jgi:PAS domain S-box-containing protein
MGILEDITERKQAERKLHDANAIQRLLLESSSLGISFCRDRTIVWANPRMVDLFGIPLDQMQGASTRVIYPSDESYETLGRLAYPVLARGERSDHTLQLRHRDGTAFWCRFIGKALTPAAPHEGTIWMFEDMTDRKKAEQARHDMEVKLRYSQKLECIGQLAAGIAHEINTPMQYIGDNTRFLQDAFADLCRVVGAIEDLPRQGHGSSGLAELLVPIDAALRAADVEFLVTEIPKAIDQSLQGVDRVTTIVRAMKEFSHPGSGQKTAVDLNHAIESTLTVARNEYKYVADLETDFDPNLPPVPCLPGEFNQVILNLIVNAAHAITDVVGKGGERKGRITVRSRLEGDWVEVRVEDTGAGIPEGVRDRIFEPFFTTKPMGLGSGQGLAIAHSVIVEKHAGTLAFETRVGHGTVFIIRLPLKEPAPKPTGAPPQDSGAFVQLTS